MAASPAGSVFAALRAAVRATDEPLLINIGIAHDRDRVVRALGADTPVETAGSLAETIDRMAAERYDLVVFEVPQDDHDVDPGLALREIAQRSELVAYCPGQAKQILRAFAMGAHALIPQPLPDSDALLKAHMRWLTGNRRTRVRGAALVAALERHASELEATDPALSRALANVNAARARPRVVVLGHASGLGIEAGDESVADPDVVVVIAEEEDRVEARLAHARARAAGAAIVVVDANPVDARVCACLYGGARAYLSRDGTDGLAQLIDTLGKRRMAEANGRRLVEILAKYGALDEPTRGGTVPADLDAQFLTESTGSGGPIVPSGHEVLVVDDELVVLTVLREALRRGGYRVTTAASAEQAIDLLKEKVFDLVLTDKNLTGASGLEVLRFANTLKPAPAVILITGYSSYDSAAEALEIGAMDYIEKPIRDVELLRQRVRRALSRRDEHTVRGTDREASQEKARVLLVEVEVDKRTLLCEFLRRTYDVISVASGDEALARLKQERFDVVLADRNLPGVSGLRVIEQAQQLLPHCASVLYTAYPNYESVKEAFEVGVDAYLVRPSEDLKALEEKVAGALRGKGGILLG